MKYTIVIFIAVVVVAGMGGNPCPAYGEELSTLKKAQNKIFPKATEFIEQTLELTSEQRKQLADIAAVKLNPIYDQVFHVATAKKDQEVMGYILEDTVVGKWGPIHYLLGVDPSGKIVNMVVLSYQEKRGKPVAKPRFIRQFIGKRTSDPLRLQRDINGVTGATISSRGMTDGVRKMLYLFEEFVKL